MRGSIDRLSANIAELRRELDERLAGDLALLRAAVRQVYEETREALRLRGPQAG